MSIAIWRYSHFVLAIFSSVFLLIATITGAILAIETANQKIYPYYVQGSNQLTIAQTLENLSKVYPEIISVSKDDNDFVIVNAPIQNNNESFYVNPFTGEKLVGIIQKSKLYKFSLSLHRSLFLKKTGRFIVGFTSFLFLLIAVSGIIIIAKRQGGIQNFFSKIVNENLDQYYHIVLSRWALIPILLIAVSGIYLSLLRFTIIKEDKVSHSINFETINEIPKISYTDFDVFSNHTLAELKVLEFPFSNFIEDYYTLKLENKELLINQFTGEVLSRFDKSYLSLLNEFMQIIHTGTTSLIWAIVLGLVMLVVLFLMYSGFIMRYKKTRALIVNKYVKDECTHVILVGSEGKSTLKHACLLHEELHNKGIRSFLAEMNAYASYKKMKHLVVLTATYGSGEAPSNATNFLGLLSYVKQEQPYSFSVVGFGSTAYPEFCKFAYAVDNTLLKNKKTHQLIPIQTVNNQSFEAFSQWVNLWAGKNNMVLQLDASKIKKGKQPKPKKFEVVSNSYATNVANDTFLLKLKAKNNKQYKSGDLLAVFPKKETTERLYSISKMSDGTILMSVKKHDFGVCSTYMSSLKIGETLNGYLVKNTQFHFPRKSNSGVILIATGTGIGPFLGMIESNKNNVAIDLYWGDQSEASYSLYTDIIEQALLQNKLTSFVPVYSRSTSEKLYVQDVIKKDASKFANFLKERGTVMICGSIAMQKSVLATLNDICVEELGERLSVFQNRSQIKMDCY